MMERSDYAINDRAKIPFIGQGEDMLCEMCKGRGIIYCITCKKGNISPPWLSGLAKEICSVCEGKKEMKCPVCDGKGEV
jgi:hypothetical protein